MVRELTIKHRELNEFERLRKSINMGNFIKNKIYREINDNQDILLSNRTIVSSITINSKNKILMFYLRDILNKAGFKAKIKRNKGKERLYISI
jgi:hypothetical protein